MLVFYFIKFLLILKLKLEEQKIIPKDYLRNLKNGLLIKDKGIQCIHFFLVNVLKEESGLKNKVNYLLDFCQVLQILSDF